MLSILPVSSFASYYDQYNVDPYQNQNYYQPYYNPYGSTNGYNPYGGYYDTYQNQGYYNTTDSTITALWDLLARYGTSISKSVTDTTSGIIFTLTSSDTYVSSRLQTINYDGVKSEIFGRNMYVTKDNHWNGVQVQITSSDYATVSKIQDYVRWKLGFAVLNRYIAPPLPQVRIDPRNTYNQNYSYNYNQNYDPNYNQGYNYNPSTGYYYTQPYARNSDIIRSISNLTDGATIVITSNDPTTANYIQSYSRSFVPLGLGDSVSVTIINTSLGIQMRITSSYQNVINRIQSIVNSNYTAPNGYNYVNR